MRVRSALAGRRILITGATGFVGEALLARLLAAVPDARPVILVRPRGSASAADRVARMARRPAFAPLGTPEQVSAALAAVTVLEGDLADLPALPADLDVVVHCAGEVSFDPPIDEAFTTNVVGTAGLVAAVAAACGDRPVHYVHVSTAYVAGLRRGAVAEASVDHEVDWRAETAAGLAARGRADAASRDPAVLARLRGQAAAEHRRAGPITVAGDTERRRREWVDERCVAAGGERARGLGWTDVYTFTKAMGERAVEELGAALSVSIVRPSIIESALAVPSPGWIEGFKMADPIILAYGRGELPEFPAAPDSIVDIVPVDHVVHALMAVAASPPPAGRPAYYHVSSGARNPLTFNGLYEHVRAYFDAHPFPVGDRGGAPLPVWRFPGAEAVERALVTGERAHRLADRAVGMAPRGRRVRELAHDLDRRRDRLEFLRRYIDLYRSYTQAELVFRDEHTLALHDSLDAADADLDFDTAVVDWAYYLEQVHCPAVTAGLRARAAVRRPAPSREVVALPRATDVVAAFDMDGTLLSSNVVETYLWVRLRELDGPGRARELGRVATKLPGWLAMERRDRGAFLRAVYRRYAGADPDELAALVDEAVTPHVLERVSAAALRRVREHRAAGHRTVLITGAVEPLTRPLAPLFDRVVCAELAVGSDGAHTGFLARPPLVGEARASWLVHYAADEGLDLARSYAYADSHSDLPLLRAVGHPTAVSPDVALHRAARAGRWPVVDWAAGGAASRVVVPDGGR